MLIASLLALAVVLAFLAFHLSRAVEQIAEALRAHALSVDANTRALYQLAHDVVNFTSHVVIRRSAEDER